MELTCKQCGKTIKISLEELSVAGGVVVCPQCLHEFRAEGVELLPARAAVEAEEAVEVLYCHDCGHRLPQPGLKYCPYCGVSLAKVLTGAATAEEDAAAAAQAVPPPKGASGESASRLKLRMPLIHGLPQDYGTVMGSPATRRFLMTLIVLLSLSFVTLMVAIFLQQ